MEPISNDEAEARLEVLSGWSLREEGLRRQFSFPGFPEALTFVLRVGFLAEAADHHPEIVVNYTRVALTYTTHDVGGLTDKDFEGAVAATAAAAAMGGS